MPSTPLAPPLLAVAIGLALAGCAAPVAAPPPQVAPAWQSPLPHGGTVGELRRWWAQFDDPLLARLIDAAEQASPTIASAGARIAEAEARRIGANAALLPSLDASANAARGRQDLTLPLGTTASAELRASWELDVFGGNRAARDAATLRRDSADAQWHDARVLVAADTANTYVSLRSCEARLAQAQLDAASRAETARLTELSRRAGFESPANAALARASASQGQLLVRQQSEQCDQTVKALVALTAIAEPELRALLAAALARVPEPTAIDVPSVPAAALAQRPDVYARAREVAAASADIGEAEAARLPRVTLTGALGASHIEFDGGRFNGTLWSIGPIAVSVPLFDAGARRANVVAAQARYDEATSAYAATLRGAIRDVENALITLQGTADRSADAQTAADNFEISVRATEARYRSGFGTLFELEDARRSALAAQITLIELRRERVAAWISLYRALGGGWSEALDTRTAANGPQLGAAQR